MTPAQALENLARLAEAHLLNGPDRRAINDSIAVLHAAITPAPPPATPRTTAEERAKEFAKAVTS